MKHLANSRIDSVRRSPVAPIRATKAARFPVRYRKESPRDAAGRLPERNPRLHDMTAPNADGIANYIRRIGDSAHGIAVSNR